MPGSTLAQGKWLVSARAEAADYRDTSPSEAEANAAEQGRYDAVDFEHVESLGLSYGITDFVQVDARLGWYAGSGFIQAESTSGGVESADADPSGLTDAWITARFRVVEDSDLKSEAALIAGVRLPTGDDEERLSDGSLLDPDDQPGSGAVGYVFGVGWTQTPAHQLTVDASAVWVENNEHDGFEEGDRFDAAVACAWRLKEDARAWPVWTVVGEASWEWYDSDERGGVSDGISNGSSVYVVPGVRCRFSETAVLGIAVPIPVDQDLAGHQAETRYRGVVTLDLFF